MSNDSPAAILFDKLGNPVGVMFDGYVYRLQTTNTITDSDDNGPVTVKRPNTPATESDSALVVSISPNNPVLSPTLVIPTVSLSNSTVAPLASNILFQGSSEDVSEFVSTDVTVLSDVDSASNGLLFEWSQDNVLWNYSEFFTVAANVGQFFSLSPRAKYFRLSYANSSLSQTNFAISTVHYPINRSTYKQNLNIPIANQYPAEIVRSVLSAQEQGSLESNFINLQSTTGGFLKSSIDTVVYPSISVPETVQIKHVVTTSGVFFTGSFDNNTVAGNSIVIVVKQIHGFSGATYNLSDNQGNIYTSGPSVSQTDVGQIDVWYTVSNGGPYTLDLINLSQSTTIAIQMYEVSGLLIGYCFLDQYSVNDGYGTELTTNSVFTSRANEFCIASFAVNPPTSVFPGPEWTDDPTVPDSGNEFMIKNSAGLVTGTASTNTPVDYLGILLTFFPMSTSLPIVSDDIGRLVVISEISDGYNGIATVKSANESATSSDSALVVAISPNNPITTSVARPATNNTSSVAASISNVTLLNSNSIRLGATIYNDSSSSLLYLKLGPSASLTDFTTRIFPMCYYEVPFGYTGEIDGFWTSAIGNARIGELT